MRAGLSDRVAHDLAVSRRCGVSPSYRRKMLTRQLIASLERWARPTGHPSHAAAADVRAREIGAALYRLHVRGRS